MTTQNIKEPQAVQLSQRGRRARFIALKDEKLLAEFHLYLAQWWNRVIVHHWVKGRAQGDGTLVWRSLSFTQVWCGFSRVPQAGSVSLTEPHTWRGL